MNDLSVSLDESELNVVRKCAQRLRLKPEEFVYACMDSIVEQISNDWYDDELQMQLFFRVTTRFDRNRLPEWAEEGRQ